MVLKGRRIALRTNAPEMMLRNSRVQAMAVWEACAEDVEQEIDSEEELGNGECNPERFSV